jgi:cytoskeleton protein RodZ
MTEAWTEPVPKEVTAGELLRRARESTGLHVAALAVSLKVPVRKLEALEEDRWDQLSDAVFVRALASSVCRTLKIDPHPILERLPQTTAPRLVNVDDGINAPFRAPSDGAPPSIVNQLTKPVFLVVFALLLGALVLILLPTSRQEEKTAEVAKPALAAATTPMVIPAPVVEPVSAPAPLPVASAVRVAASAAPAASAVAAPVVAAPMVAAPAVESAVATPAAQSASGLIVIRAKGPSWVEITDAKGAVGIRKVLAGGETAGASGELPLQVTIGRVDMIDVQVRGKPYDLRRVSKDNVARFQVK